MKKYLLLFILLASINKSFSQVDACGTNSLSVGNAVCSTTAYTIPSSFGADAIAAPSCATITRDGWYTFTAISTSTTITATTNRNLAIAVYSGACGSLSQVACANAGGSGTTETATFATVVSTVYSIRVIRVDAGSNSMTGNICIYSPPSNDEPCSAIAVTVGSSCSSVTYSNFTATATTPAPPAPGCAGYSGGDVWFTAVVPISGKLIFDSQVGGMGDGGMALYTGTCSSLTLLTCDDNSGVGSMPKITQTGLTPGTTIWVRFWENGNDNNNTFGLCIYDDTPANDEPCFATALTVGTSCSTTTYTNVGASATTPAPPVPGCGTYSGGDVWFTAVVPASGSLIIDAIDGGVTNGDMAIYSGTCSSLTLIACDDNSGVGNMPRIEQSGLTPGTTIWIRFWENGNNTFGTFSICVYDDTPANDNPCNAFALSVGSSCSYTTQTNLTAIATSPAPTAPGCAGYSGGDVWFTAVVPASGRLIINSDIGTLLDGGMAIYSGTCSALTLITCDDNSSPNGAMPLIDASGLTVGATIWIRFWENGNNNNGTFNICVYDPCPGGSQANDLPCSATSLSLGVNLAGSNSCTGSTSEPAAPACWNNGTLNTVWYTVVCPASGQLKIRTSLGTLSNTQIALYTGSCGSLSLAPGTNCNDDAPNCGTSSYSNSELTATGLTSGATYYVAVDGSQNLTGTFNITAIDGTSSFPPAPSQECFSPSPVCGVSSPVGNPGYQAYGNVCDFPGGGTNCLNQGERASTWYTIPINAAGTLTFDIVPNDWQGSPSTTSTDYDFAVWKTGGTGSTTCALIATGAAPIKCNYSALGVTGLNTGGNAPAAYPGFDGAYETPITVASGETYSLVVSNYSNSTSGFSINIGAAAPVSYTAPTSVNWTGGNGNTDWNSSLNWGSCVSPSCTLDAVVTASSSNQPVLTSSTGVRNLTINAGATLTINAGVTLTICGSFTNNGQLLASPTSIIQFSDPTATHTLSGNMVGSSAFGNLTINKTAGSVVLNQDLAVTGNLTTSNNTSILNTNGRTVRVGGNFNNFNAGTTFTNVTGGTLEFNGTGAQNYSPGGSLTLNNVIVNNTGSGVTLVGNNMILGTNGNLTLTNGLIITGGAREVTVTNTDPTSVSAGKASSYIEGNLRRSLLSTGSYDFPIGHATKGFQRANINFTGATTIGNLIARFDTWSAVPAALGSTECFATYNLPAMDNGYWTITANANPTSGTYTTTLYPTNGTNSGTAMGWTVMKAPTTAGIWVLSGTCASSTAAAVRRTGMNGFSVFGSAQTTAPLPIELVDFTAKSENKNIKIQWTTATETNNNFFTVEKTLDGVNFEIVTTVKGAENSNQFIKYSAIDKNPFKGVSYYRLKQTDYDGAFKYSELIAVEIKEEFKITLVPNPSAHQNLTYLEIEGDLSKIELSYSIYESTGKELLSQTVVLNDESNGRVPLNNGLDLSPGVYNVKITIDGKRYFKKLVIL